MLKCFFISVPAMFAQFDYPLGPGGVPAVMQKAVYLCGLLFNILLTMYNSSSMGLLIILVLISTIRCTSISSIRGRSISIVKHGRSPICEAGSLISNTNYLILCT